MHPYLTAGIPGCGGTIKTSVEDFYVEELPSYLPSGSGEHCYLTFEKRGITTLEAIRRIAIALKIPEREIGYAGMKDAVGVTRQTISLARITPQQALELQLDGLVMVAAERHGNKLKLGHLRGNRFRIVIRGVLPEAEQLLPPLLELLGRKGVPNYFGAQRYGAQGNSHLIGAAMLRREWRACVDHLIGQPDALRDQEWRDAIVAYQQGQLEEALRLFPRHCRSERDVLQRLVGRPEGYERAFGAVHPRLKKLYLSALQSYLFDQVVALRIDRLDQLLDGDLACKHINGACFQVEDAALEQERADVFEISPSGPMFGRKMKRPTGAADQLEQGVLQQSGIEQANFEPHGGVSLDGERRPLRVPVADLSGVVEGDLVTLEFSLPKGSYATSLLREITKTF